MAAMKEKKIETASAGLTTTVVGDTNDLRVQTATLGKALAAKAPTSEQEETDKVLKLIDADFEEALKHFA